jgi:putative hemolysin
MMPLGLFLLILAAIYLGALEAAFSALMRLSLRLAAERSDRPDALGEFLVEPLLLFIPIRVLLGLVTAGATALFAEVVGVDGAHKLALVLVSVMVFVIFCELLVPILIIGRDPARGLDVLLPTFVPIARALGPLTRWIARRMVTRGPAVSLANDQEAADPDATHASAPAASGAETEEQVGEEERRLLQSIADFGDTLVREVMTPRPDIVAIPETASIGELRALFREQEYSRFPVFKESIDNIAGFVFIKDLVSLGPSDDSRPITPLIRPAVVVPETKLVPELLKQFQGQQTQSAIVVDEYGGTAGLVTFEDLVEEIVGEIRDEYDVETAQVVDEGHGRFVFSGKVDIDAVAQRLDVDIEREGFETVGGYLLARIGRVPTVGERFDVDGLSVEVLEAERRRVTKVRIMKREPGAEETTA